MEISAEGIHSVFLALGSTHWQNSRVGLNSEWIESPPVSRIVQWRASLKFSVSCLVTKPTMYAATAWMTTHWKSMEGRRSSIWTSCGIVYCIKQALHSDGHVRRKFAIQMHKNAPKRILPVLGGLFGLLFLARQPVWALALFDISGGRFSGTTSVSCTKQMVLRSDKWPKMSNHINQRCPPRKAISITPKLWNGTKGNNNHPFPPRTSHESRTWHSKPSPVVPAMAFVHKIVTWICRHGRSHQPNSHGFSFYINCSESLDLPLRRLVKDTGTNFCWVWVRAPNVVSKELWVPFCCVQNRAATVSTISYNIGHTLWSGGKKLPEELTKQNAWDADTSVGRWRGKFCHLDCLFLRFFVYFLGVPFSVWRFLTKTTVEHHKPKSGLRLYFYGVLWRWVWKGSKMRSLCIGKYARANSRVGLNFEWIWKLLGLAIAYQFRALHGGKPRWSSRSRAWLHSQ